MTECCLTCLVLLPGSDNKPVPDDLRGLEASWGSQKSFWNEVLLSDQQEDFQEASAVIEAARWQPEQLLCEGPSRPAGGAAGPSS